MTERFAVQIPAQVLGVAEFCPAFATTESGVNK